MEKREIDDGDQNEADRHMHVEMLVPSDDIDDGQNERESKYDGVVILN
jgi:hypothetical protein